MQERAGPTRRKAEPGRREKRTPADVQSPRAMRPPAGNSAPRAYRRDQWGLNLIEISFQRTVRVASRVVGSKDEFVISEPSYA